VSKNYSFQYIEGTSKPSQTISAKNDKRFYKKLERFLDQKPSRSLVHGSIKMTEFRIVADPPGRLGPIGGAVTRLLEDQDSRGVAPLSQL
jgi:hypothetical protein